VAAAASQAHAVPKAKQPGSKSALGRRLHQQQQSDLDVLGSPANSDGQTAVISAVTGSALPQTAAAAAVAVVASTPGGVSSSAAPGDEEVRTQALPAECSGPANNTCQELWGMNRIRAPDLWRRISGVPTADGWVLRGTMLSNGVYMDHNNLKEQFNASDSFTPRGATPTGGQAGISGFGTHQAGTFVGAWDSGDTRGIVGVPGRAQVISCNMIPTNLNGATITEIISDCIKHAADTNASWVVSNSWYFVNPSSPGAAFIGVVRDAIQQFVCDKGGIFVVPSADGLCRDFPDFNRFCVCSNPNSPWNCAGGIRIGVNISDAGIYPNGTKVEGLKVYPAAYAEELDCVIAVANIGYADAERGMEADQIHPTSNWGNAVKIAAPGWDILSDWYQEVSTDPWASNIQTSTASSLAHVSGTIYLFRNAFPTVSAADIMDCLLRTAVDQVLPPSDTFFNDPDAVVGGGILDVDLAYTCVELKAAGSTGLICLNRTYTLQYGACDNIAVAPAGLYIYIGQGGAPSVTVSSPGPYPPGITDVSVTTTDGGGTTCTSRVTVVPCTVVCNSATATAPKPPMGSTTCTLPAASLPNMVDEASLGSTMLRLTRSPAGPYPLGVTSITFTAMYPGGVESPSATCTLTVLGGAATPMGVAARNPCVWRRSASIREYCFKASDLVAVTGGSNACTGGPPRASSIRCGVGPGCSRWPSLFLSSAAAANSATQFPGSQSNAAVRESAPAAHEQTADVAAAAAAAGNDSAATALFWGMFPGYRGYAVYSSPWPAFQLPTQFSTQYNGFIYPWQARRYSCPTTPHVSFQAQGLNCKVASPGTLCVQFDGNVPLQLVTAQVTMSDKNLRRRVTSRITMWNPASATRPAGVPANCIAA
jgi:hypothetical protein